ADDGEAVVEPLERADERARAGSEHDFLPDLVEHGRGQPFEQGHAAAQRLGEVDLAAHGLLGDPGDLVETAGVGGQQLDDLAADEGGVDVHDDEPLGPAGQAGALDGDVDLLGGGLGGERDAQLVGVGPGDGHLDAGDRPLGEAFDAVDVGPGGGDAPGDAGDGGG